MSQFAHEHRLDYLFLTGDDFYREAHPDAIRFVVQRLVRTDANFELLRQDDGGSIYKIHEPASVSVGNGIIPASRYEALAWRSTYAAERSLPQRV